VTTKFTYAKGIWVPSAVMKKIKDKEETLVKDEESGDIWCEVSESKTHSEYNIPEELWGNWPIKEEAAWFVAVMRETSEITQLEY